MDYKNMWESLKKDIIEEDEANAHTSHHYQWLLKRIAELEGNARKEIIAKEMKYSRLLKYQKRLREFLENFGIFTYSYGSFGVELIFEGHFYKHRLLANQMGLHYYESYDDDDCEEGNIMMSWEYLRTIRNLWVNRYIVVIK